jgi:hypothetical protein
MCLDIEGYGQCVRLVDDEPNCTDDATPAPECSDDSDCDDDQRCNRSGECEPRPTGGAGLGESCESNDGCNSGVCFVTPEGGVCARSCDWLDPQSCPSGFYCNGSATGACGSGICLAGVEGDVPLGGACSRDTDCETLFCSFEKCAEPCVPGSAVACPKGFVCRVSGSGAGCGACTTAARVGEDCVVNADCQSLICATEGDDTYCTSLCEDDEQCPDGFTCEAAGDVRVCAPPPGGVAPDGGMGGSAGGGGDDGCGCVTPGRRATLPPRGWWLVALGLLLSAGWLCRRRSR